MIELLDKQRIILKHYHEGKSQRAIQRETGVCRKTIRKYIRDYERSRANIMEQDEMVSQEELMGAIEGQVRHTITRRMKRIGARWTKEGANRMGGLLAAKSNVELGHYVNNSEETYRSISRVRGTN